MCTLIHTHAHKKISFKELARGTVGWPVGGLQGASRLDAQAGADTAVLRQMTGTRVLRVSPSADWLRPTHTI